MDSELEALLARANAVGAVPSRAFVQDGLIIEHAMQDVEPALRQLDDMRIDGLDGYTKDKDLLFIGKIPETLVYQWCQDHGVKIQELLHDPDGDIAYKMLNDPDLRRFRLFDGRW